MTETIILRGGASIGSRHAASPFATLSIDEDVLKIEDFFLGKYVFLPQHITSIEPTINSYLGEGIRINHLIENYNSTVIFYSSKDPNVIINEIKSLGFLDKINNKITSDEKEVFNKKQQKGKAFKKPVGIIFFTLLSIIIVLHLLTFIIKAKEIPVVNHMVIRIAITSLFVSSILTLVSTRFRKLVLKEGGDFNELKPVLFVLIFYSGLLLLS